ncbi:MAG: HesA/MoeB/ThiF family protein [bacterium]
MQNEPPTTDDIFSRQILLREIGRDGQMVLFQSRVAIVGAGAVGGAIAELLARAGVGTITIIDHDIVVFSNLPRQTLFTWQDAECKLFKAEAARRHLNEIMPTCRVFPIVESLAPDNVGSILRGADIVADGTDNIETRFVINDWCVTNGIPWVYAGAAGTRTSVYPVLGKNRCLRCLFPDTPSAEALPTCREIGVLGSAATLAASLSSTLVLRILLNDTPESEFLTADVWTQEFSRISIEKMRLANGNRPCPLCDSIKK